MSQWLKILPEVQETQEMWVQSLGGEGPLSKEMAVSVPLQYAYLENPMDRGAWWATVQKVPRIRHDRTQAQNVIIFKTHEGKMRPQVL